MNKLRREMTSEPMGEAMVFTGTHRPFESHQIKLPALQEGQVLVKITYTTICTSDLHTFCGRRQSPEPSILGHEIIGRIISIASTGAKDFEGSDLKVGDYVTWTVYAHDHSETIAANGFPQKSKSLFKYGHQKLGATTILSGGFASHCLLRKGTDIFKLPKSLSAQEAAPLNCTHATIAGAIRVAGSLENKNVLVVGAGMLGLSACAMSKESGAKNVFIMDLNKQRSGHALNFGAIEALNPGDTTKLLNQTQAKGGIDTVIETSGSPSAIESVMELLNIGGRLVLVGSVFKQRDLHINAEKIVRNLITIAGLHNYTPADLNQAVTFLTSYHQKYPFEALIGKEFSLKNLNEAFAEAEHQNHYRVGVSQE